MRRTLVCPSVMSMAPWPLMSIDDPSARWTCLCLWLVGCQSCRYWKRRLSLTMWCVAPLSMINSPVDVMEMEPYRAVIRSLVRGVIGWMLFMICERVSSLELGMVNIVEVGFRMLVVLLMGSVGVGMCVVVVVGSVVSVIVGRSEAVCVVPVGRVEGEGR